MKTNRKIGFLIFILSLAFVTLACGQGGGTEPAQAPPPAEPTTAPAEPTAPPEEPTAVPEPTEAPAEEPTDVPVEEPTEEASGEGEGSEEPPIAGSDPEGPPPEDTVYIEAVNGFRDDLGTLYIVGLVTNNTDRVVDNVEVEIEYNVSH